MKTRLGILCGGRSVEHEVSLKSAHNIVAAVNKDRYDIVLIGVDREGGWHVITADELSQLVGEGKGVSSTGDLVNLSSLRLDVVFPVLHGSFGEDGTVQGLLKIAGIPFVGPDVLGSAIGMDKDVMKRLLQQASIPIPGFMTFHTPEDASYEDVAQKLGSTLFIKPANTGSSVGISKVVNEDQFNKAVAEAFSFDIKILIEEAVSGVEIECSVLGNEHPRASLPGKVVTTHNFYSYEAKYLDDNGAALEIPAHLPEEVVKRIQELSLQTYKVLEGEGMARVDMFLKENGELLINEVNTIPGFTSISMYPKLWEVSGLSYSDLIDELISLALQRFEKQQKLRTSYS
jgi:D-alanine-D-alanine ligase